MPTYQYACPKCRATFGVVKSMSAAAEETRCECGATADRLFASPLVAGASCWPMTSQALAVHPEQVGEANERNRVHGVGVQYDPTGLAHIPDRAERKKLLRLEGKHDNNGGYGD